MTKTGWNNSRTVTTGEERRVLKYPGGAPEPFRGSRGVSSPRAKVIRSDDVGVSAFIRDLKQLVGRARVRCGTPSRACKLLGVEQQPGISERINRTSPGRRQISPKIANGVLELFSRSTVPGKLWEPGHTNDSPRLRARLFFRKHKTFQKQRQIIQQSVRPNELSFVRQ